MEDLRPTPGEDITLTFPVMLTVSDLLYFNRAIQKRQPNLVITLVMVVAACVLASGVLIALKMETLGSTSSFLLYLCFIYLGLLLIGKLFRKTLCNNMYSPDGFSLAEKLYTVAPDGITVEHPHSIGTVKWPLVKRIMPAKDAVYIMIDTMLGYPIPYRCLPATVSPDEFCQLLQRYQKAASA